MYKILVSILMLSSAAFAGDGSGNISNVISAGQASAQTGATTTGASAVSSGLQAPSLVMPIGNAASLVTLVGSFSPAAGDFNVLYSTSGSTGQYKVPAGKTLFITSVNYMAGGQGQIMQLCWATAALSSKSVASASPPAGLACFGDPLDAQTGGFYGSDTIAWTFMATTISFPANSYPLWRITPGGVEAVILSGFVQ